MALMVILPAVLPVLIPPLTKCTPWLLAVLETADALTTMPPAPPIRPLLLPSMNKPRLPVPLTLPVALMVMAPPPVWLMLDTPLM